MKAPGTLAATVARADRIGGPRRLGAAPAGTPLPAGWVDLASAGTDPDTAMAWVADARAGFAGGHADVAGAAVAAQVAGTLVGLVAPALLTARRGIPVSLGAVAVHRDPGGWIDQVAVLAHEVRVLPDDPDAARPDTIVLDRPDDLIDAIADDLVATLTPVFALVRRVAPFGRSGMWGSTADEIGVVATRLARAGVLDADAAWRTADDLVDAIAERVPRLRARPRRVDVSTSSGPVTFSRRSTCCLFYKLAPPGPARDAAWCATCPLLSREEQHDRLVASARLPT